MHALRQEREYPRSLPLVARCSVQFDSVSVAGSEACSFAFLCGQGTTRVMLTLVPNFREVRGVPFHGLSFLVLTLIIIDWKEP